MSENENGKTAYDPSSIVVMKGLEAVRHRPGMYIGNTQDGTGLHHMLFEILDNSIDEAGEGYAKAIKVIMHEDNSVTVTDDGRGIPTGIHPEEQVPAIELVFMKLHAGGKFDGSSYKASGGLHGVGAAVVNALSVRTTVQVMRDGELQQISFSRGEITEPLHNIKAISSKLHGTSVTFVPDEEIFGSIEMDSRSISLKIREKACLNPGVRIEFVDERDANQNQVFCFENGIADFIALKNHGKTSSLPCGIVKFEGSAPIVIRTPGSPDKPATSDVALAFEWSENTYTADIACYTNNIPQPDGGSHLTGMKTAFLNTLRSYMQNNPDSVKKKKNTEILSDDIFEGMTAVLAIKFPQPQFSSQTKEKLVSTDAQKATYAVVSKLFAEWLDVNPPMAKRIIQRVINSAEARIAAREASNRTRESTKKNGLDVSFIPGKHAQCDSKDASICELFIVEGDSAGGTAKQARERHNQGILALRGKILNTYGASVQKILASQEIGNIISAIGVKSIGQSCDIDSLRYNKVIIMTDADDDGAHIASLVITFFKSCLPEVIRRGHLYLAQPPLYAAHFGKTTRFILDDEEMQVFIEERLVNERGYRLTWGHGEEQGTASAADTLSFLKSLRLFKEQMLQVEGRMGVRDDTLNLLISTGFNLSGVEDVQGYLDDYIAYAQPRINTSKNVAYRIESNEAGITIHARRRGVNSHRAYDIKSLTDGIIHQLLEDRTAYVVSYINADARLCSENDNMDDIPLLTVKQGQEAANAAGSKGIKNIQRFKGLGEMNSEQLKMTTMDPASRRLLQVTMDDEDEASDAIDRFMGKNASARREAYAIWTNGNIGGSDTDEVTEDEVEVEAA